MVFGHDKWPGAARTARAVGTTWMRGDTVTKVSRRVSAFVLSVSLAFATAVPGGAVPHDATYDTLPEAVERVRAIFEHRDVPIATPLETGAERLDRIAREVLSLKRGRTLSAAYDDVRRSVNWIAENAPTGAVEPEPTTTPEPEQPPVAAPPATSPAPPPQPVAPPPAAVPPAPRPTQPSPINTAGVRHETLDCLPDTTVAAVRNDPTTIRDTYTSCRDELNADLGPEFTTIPDDGLRAIFTGIVAYRLAPYGNSHAHTINELLAANVLDCDNYMSLAYHLYGLTADTTAAETHFVGWEGGAIGNHGQMIVTELGQWSVLIDPTIAVVAAIEFDTIVQGTPSGTLVDFSTRQELGTFHTNVVTALLEGRYRSSDLLYYFEEHEQLAAGG